MEEIWLWMWGIYENTGFLMGENVRNIEQIFFGRILIQNGGKLTHKSFKVLRLRIG